MEDRETPRMRKYGESKTSRIMMATVPHVTKYQADRFFSTECTSVNQSFLLSSEFAKHVLLRQTTVSFCY